MEAVNWRGEKAEVVAARTNPHFNVVFRLRTMSGQVHDEDCERSIWFRRGRAQTTSAFALLGFPMRGLIRERVTLGQSDETTDAHSNHFVNAAETVKGETEKEVELC